MKCTEEAGSGGKTGPPLFSRVFCVRGDGRGSKRRRTARRARLVEAHDVALPVYIGRVYVKQAALKAAHRRAEKGSVGLLRKI